MANFPVGVPTLEIYRGDSFSQSYVLKDAVTGDPRDLSAEGWSGWIAQWRPFVDSDETVDFTVDVSDVAEGRVGIALSAAQTAGLRRGVWDLQASQGSVVRTWLSGNVDFVKDVTHV